MKRVGVVKLDDEARHRACRFSRRGCAGAVSGQGLYSRAPTRPDPDRWKALAVCLAAGFMTLLDVSIVNVALPSIEAGPDAREASCSGSSRATRSRSGCCSCRRGASATRTGGGRCSCSASRCSCSPARPAGWRRRRSLARRDAAPAGVRRRSISPQISGLIQSLFRGEERGTGVRPLRHDHRRVDRGRPAPRRRADRAVRRASDGWRAVFFVNLPIGAAILLPARRYLPGADRASAGPGARPARRRAAGRGGRVHSSSRSSSSARGTARAARAVPAGRRAAGRVGADERRYGRTREPLVSHRPVPDPLLRARRAGGPHVLRRVHRRVLHPHAVPAARARTTPLWRPAWPPRRSRIGGGAVASARQPPGPAPRPQARGLRAGHVSSGLAGVWLAVGAHPGTTSRCGRRRRCCRRPRRRARDLAEPDPSLSPGAGRSAPAARAACCRPVSGSARPPGSRSPAASSTTRSPLRTATSRRVPPRLDQHRRVRRRGARARTG